MPIIGVGIDVVDIDRFMQSLERTPALRGRLFTDAEASRPPASLAARFAAKEAMAKALGAPVGMGWHDAEIVSEETGIISLAIGDTLERGLTGDTLRERLRALLGGGALQRLRRARQRGALG